MKTWRKGDRLHHDDGSHRASAHSAKGSDLDWFEANAQRHFQEGPCELDEEARGVQSKTWRTVTEAADVTPEILKLVEDVVDGWYAEGPIDWEDVWDRVDGAELKDGSTLDTGDSLVSPAIRKIKTHIRDLRKNG